jgi:putative phage-type endonuclease
MEVQRSKEWFEKRKGLITGSSVGAILGLNPWRTPADVMRSMVREYHGAESEFKGNIATEYGTLNEIHAQADFELEYGVDVVETGFVISDDNPWLGASPDGLINDDFVLEIKCPFGLRDNQSPKFKTSQEQMHYYAQMQIEMLCTGRDRCYFYQWNPYSSELENVYINRVWLAGAIPVLYNFYLQYLKERELPRAEYHLGDPIPSISKKLLADEYNDAKECLELAKIRLDNAKDALIDISKANGNKCIISGLKVMEIERKGSVSYAKVVKDLSVDKSILDKYTGKPTKYWSVK